MSNVQLTREEREA